MWRLAKAYFVCQSPVMDSLERRGMKIRFQSKARLMAGVVLIALAAVVLAGLAVAANGKGAAAAQYAYGPAGKAYGKTKITICHKGKTLRVAAPAWKGHQKHGDHLGAC